MGKIDNYNMEFKLYAMSDIELQRASIKLLRKNIILQNRIQKQSKFLDYLLRDLETNNIDISKIIRQYTKNEKIPLFFLK